MAPVMWKDSKAKLRLSKALLAADQAPSLADLLLVVHQAHAPHRQQQAHTIPPAQ
jgi:hypothetical protein